MSKRIPTVVAILVAVVATGLAVSTASGASIPIRWKVSGTIANVLFYPST